MAIQGDGKIVAAGRAVPDFAPDRYKSDGTLDPTFGGDGKVTTDFAGDFDESHGVAIQGDGKIVAAGSAFDPGPGGGFALARYTGLPTHVEADIGSAMPLAGPMDCGNHVARHQVSRRGCLERRTAVCRTVLVLIVLLPMLALDPGASAAPAEAKGGVHPLRIGEGGKQLSAASAAPYCSMGGENPRFDSPA